MSRISTDPGPADSCMSLKESRGFFPEKKKKPLKVVSANILNPNTTVWVHSQGEEDTKQAHSFPACEACNLHWGSLDTQLGSSAWWQSRRLRVKVSRAAEDRHGWPNS